METTNSMLNQYNDSIACRNVLEASNSILLIRPYYSGGFWVFDDERTGLLAEPFVAGAGVLIDYQLNQMGIRKEAKSVFAAVFSTLPFPGHHLQLTFRRFDQMGSVYAVENKPDFRSSYGSNEVWLCPALNLYFKDSPANLFAQFKQEAKSTTA
jgi:hypothetical protein